MKTEGDSTFVDSASVREEFVPVTSIFHRFSLESYRKRYLAYNTPKNYHTYTYLPGDSTSDKHSMAEFRNHIGLSLHEGFNKYALAGINAYVGFVNTAYQMPDTLMVKNDTVEFRHKYKENDISILDRLFLDEVGAVLPGTQPHMETNISNKATASEADRFIHYLLDSYRCRERQWFQ